MALRSRWGAFFAELRRRRVLQVLGLYGVVAWSLIEIAETTFPYLEQARRSEPERARDRYARFLEAWRDADPELRPVADDARARLEALGGTQR